MSLIQAVFTSRNSSGHLSDDLAGSLLEDKAPTDYQLAALVTDFFLTGGLTPAEHDLQETILLGIPKIKEYLAALSDIDGSSDFERSFLRGILQGRIIEESDWKILIDSITSGAVNNLFLAVLLTLIRHKGLHDSGLPILTRLMTDSGKVFDYRNNSNLGYRKVLRRYPTGALSEKAALLMPSLLMAFAEELPICSPFIVAKSLSYTGGTWDKLSSIPGFYFPKQGVETIAVLKECNVAMIVTEHDFNPADRVLYKFRSETNTVESADLIISSIASKQVAVPADSLLMDMRYGRGAFIPTLAKAEEIYKELAKLFKVSLIKSQPFYISTEEPGGSAIGNYLEILEAVTIMKGEIVYQNIPFHPAGLSQQRELVLDMTSELIGLEFPQMNKLAIRQTALRYFNSGKVWECFKKLLRVHQVSEAVINKIERNEFFSPEQLFSFDILSTKEGLISAIKQKELGNFVNFTLRDSRTQPFNNPVLYSGIVLFKRKGDAVGKNEVLGRVFHTTAVGREFLQSDSYFEIG